MPWPYIHVISRCQLTLKWNILTASTIHGFLRIYNISGRFWFAPSLPRKYAYMQAHRNSLVTKPGKCCLSTHQNFCLCYPSLKMSIKCTPKTFGKMCTKPCFSTWITTRVTHSGISGNRPMLNSLKNWLWKLYNVLV